MRSSRRLGLVFVVWVVPLVVLARPAGADRKGLASSVSGAGTIRVSVDQYGTFAGARFRPADGAPSFSWQYLGSLMLTDGTDFVWLADDEDWRDTSRNGNPPLLDSSLLDSEMVSDTVEPAKRTSQFHVSSLRNLSVDLVQETPEAGYNFVQTYTFTNPTADPMSLKMVLFNDQDHGDPADDRVGFVPGPMPRMYFIEDQDVAGPGHPSVDDRPNRISVITQPGPGLHFDGYLGVTAGQLGAFGLVYYVGSNLGVGGEFLNTIRVVNVDNGTPAGVNRDKDGDGLIDSRGDVGGALQFSVDLPAKGSTTLGINYVGGSLHNAVFQEAVAPTLQAGDADRDLDFDQLDLVQVQVAAKYLTGQTATWGEGDWNGAPGGNAQSPPPGDGQFNQLDIVAALTGGKYLTGRYAAVASGGSRGDRQTSIVYNPTTGELAVDAPAGTELTSINIDSARAIFTRQAAQNLGGSFDNDSDNNLFKATFGSSFGSLSFGNVAQTGLSEQFVRNDLTVVGSLAGGGALGNVDLVYVPEPTAAMLILLAVLSLLPLYRPCT
jgi:hypothetical protein